MLLYYKNFFSCTLLVTVISLLFTCSTSQAQGPPGVIHLENGDKVEFEEMRLFVYDFNMEQYANSGDSYFEVNYKGSYRKIPFGKIKYFELKEYNVHDGDILHDAVAEIKTKTGVKTKTEYKRLFSVEVYLKDELTGEKTEREFDFAQNGELNVRKISFRTGE